jgi:hypothetical protein
LNQRSEIGRRMSEVLNRRSEVGRRTSDIGHRKGRRGFYRKGAQLRSQVSGVGKAEDFLATRCARRTQT